jgi:hypothetical protein
MGSALRAESPTVEDTTQYELTSVTVMRGREAGTVAEWENDGWEFVTKSQGLLRTELTFRRPKSKTQRLVLAVLGGLAGLAIVVGFTVGIVTEKQAGADASEASASTSEVAAAPSEQSSAAPTEVPEPVDSDPAVAPYAYQGPQYEIVAVDEDLPVGLDQVWVYTTAFDFSTDAYKDQVRLIFTDVAHRAGTDHLVVQVVTDREVAEAEAFSTFEAFVEQYGMDYVIDVVTPKEATHWVAWYTGGLDPNTAQPSEADTAFEVVWRPGADAEFETWRPTLSR